MSNAEYQLAEDAFRDGNIGSATSTELEQHLLALSNQPINNDTVRHRDIIRGLTINHILLQRHIDGLNTQNSKTQRWVIALAVAALISSIVQIFSPVLFPAPPIVIKQQPPIVQLSCPTQVIPQASCPTTKKKN